MTGVEKAVEFLIHKVEWDTVKTGLPSRIVVICYG